MPGRQHILIIEDDSKWQSVLRETLEDEGYDVTLFGNYQEGRQALERRSFDLVILDLNLDESAPMLDGERLLRRISQHHVHTPCIIVSGQGDVHIVRNAFKQYRVVDFVAKDQFDIAAFIQIVEDGLGRAQAGADSFKSTAVSTPPGQIPEEPPGQEYLNTLRHILVDRFDEGELRTLCFHLGIDYDILPRQGKVFKAEDLLMYLRRRDRIFELVQAGKQLRPDIAWGDMP
jgi:DNA-binding NtrC family response regulator